MRAPANATYDAPMQKACGSMQPDLDSKMKTNPARREPRLAMPCASRGREKMEGCTDMEDLKVTYSNCQGNGCHEHCILKVYSKGDKVIRTERAELKGHLSDRYAICPKGLISGKFHELPERLRYPLKRVGERGEGKFERISWDQAYEEISEKLQGIMEKYGPRSLIMNTFACGIPLNMQGALDTALATRFQMLTDCTFMATWPVDASSFQNNLVDFGDKMFAQMATPTYWSRHRPNYILMWAGNPIGWTRPARMTQTLIEAQDEGTKLVSVGIIYDSTAAKSDEFVTVKAGTDAALACAMSQVLIEEGLFDADWISHHTNCPYLVREDNGQLLRRRDIDPAADEEAGAAYVMWSASADEPVYVAKGDLETVGDLEVEVEVGGIACKTAFLKIKEHLQKWTPESQEPVTGVPAATVRHLVHDFMDHMPSGVFTYYGLRYTNGGISIRAVNLFAMLSGCIGYKNGRLINCANGDGHPHYADFLIHCPTGNMADVKGEGVQIYQVLDSIDNPGPGKQAYKAWFNCWSNPVQNWPNKQMWEKIFGQMELIIVDEIRMTDTCKWADYVLPEASIIERHELITGAGDCIVLNEPAVPPIGESKDAGDMWKFIGACAGFPEEFNHTPEEWLQMKLMGLSQDPTIATLDPPLTLERLKEEKIVQLNTPQEEVDLWDPWHMVTQTGRCEPYSEIFYEIGMAIADYVPTFVNDEEKRKKYPLQYFPGRSRFFMQAQFHEIPELRELAGNVSTCGINPKLARERGIAEGDLVEVFSEHGACRAVAHLSEMFPPDMAHVWYAYPEKDYLTDPPTTVSQANGGPQTHTEFSRVCAELNDICDTLPPFLTFTTLQGNETYWDNLCDIRKVQ